MPTLFTTMTFRDPDTAMAWLRAVGFVEKAAYRDESGRLAHAQYDWGEAGGIMFGTFDPDNPHQNAAGIASCYLVVDSDADVDAVHDKALAAGGTSLMGPEDMDYGGRGATVRDPEGNQFSIGSYRGS